jgi:UDP-4-amino-4,6-dideoxy-N-acetyl-beta-L-altrosamine transaminase
MSSGNYLPYGRHSIDEQDIEAVVEVLGGNWLTTGPLIEKFEGALSQKVHSKFAASCSNGTAGLHLAALALGLGPEDVAVIPAMTFLATANAMRFVGGEVVFADVDPETGLMRPEDLKRVLESNRSRKITAVFPVHLNGQTVDMRSISEVARDFDLRVIEDACHALGTTFGNGDMTVGDCHYSDMAVFSFHAVKTVAMGEGGAVTTKDPCLHQRLVRLRSHGMIREPEDLQQQEEGFDADGKANPWYYEMHEIGYNYRLTDIQCALGLSQLAKLDQFVARRQALVTAYDTLFTELNAAVVRPVQRVAGVRAGWHLYPVLIDFDALGVDRATVMRRLLTMNVGSQVHYLPLHLQPYYRKRYGGVSLPGAEAYYARVLSLPLFPSMSNEDPQRVVDALQKALQI